MIGMIHFSLSRQGIRILTVVFAGLLLLLTVIGAKTAYLGTRPITDAQINQIYLWANETVI